MHLMKSLLIQESVVNTFQDPRDSQVFKHEQFGLVRKA